MSPISTWFLLMWSTRYHDVFLFFHHRFMLQALCFFATNETWESLPVFYLLWQNVWTRSVWTLLTISAWNHNLTCVSFNLLSMILLVGNAALMRRWHKGFTKHGNQVQCMDNQTQHWVQNCLQHKGFSCASGRQFVCGIVEWSHRTMLHELGRWADAPIFLFRGAAQQ